MSAPVSERVAARPAASTGTALPSGPTAAPGGVPEPSSASAAPAAAGRRARPGLALAVVAGCTAMVRLDAPVTHLARPGIRAGLDQSAPSASWAVGACLLAFGGLLLLGGRAGDVLGRHRVFVAGVYVFTAAAAVRAFVPGGELLVALRAAEGAGAAFATANGFALLLATFADGPARRRAIAVCTAVGAASTAGGLLLAAAAPTSAGSGRWVGLLDVPTGLAVVLLARRVPAGPRRVPGRFDGAGAVLSAVGAAALVYGLWRAAERPWGDAPVAGPVAAGSVLLAVLVGVRRRTEGPIVRPGLFRDRDRVLAFASMLLLPGALVGAYVDLGPFFQQERGWSALAAAVALLPLPLATAGAAGLAVHAERAVGAKRVMVLGALALVVENLWLAFLEPAGDYASAVLPSLVLLGAGTAFCAVPATVLATSGLRPDELGQAGSVLGALQAVGGCLGIALLATASSGYTVPADAMGAGFTAGAAVAGAGLLLALGLRPRR
ncbi:MFS transporter [Streptomyces sp. NRRL S-87]|uniref:MFS transporter n=1 Tax=Streptomyces sp. NRRL S-87 TaxID=1463920 RepID=UPI000691F291|nr:MFS transporter [Streptomyces sp. NRRL S-87]